MTMHCLKEPTLVFSHVRIKAQPECHGYVASTPASSLAGREVETRSGYRLS
jgi:hypothetical protein